MTEGNCKVGMQDYGLYFDREPRYCNCAADSALQLETLKDMHCTLRPLKRCIGKI